MPARAEMHVAQTCAAPHHTRHVLSREWVQKLGLNLLTDC